MVVVVVVVVVVFCSAVHSYLIFPVSCMDTLHQAIFPYMPFLVPVLVSSSYSFK